MRLRICASDSVRASSWPWIADRSVTEVAGSFSWSVSCWRWFWIGWRSANFACVCPDLIVSISDEEAKRVRRSASCVLGPDAVISMNPSSPTWFALMRLVASSRVRSMPEVRIAFRTTVGVAAYLA